jgi:hypothetical protein
VRKAVTPCGYGGSLFQEDVLKKLLLVCVVLSGSIFAGAIGTCTSSTLSGLVIGNPCALGGKMYSNFSNSGLDAPRINGGFMMADNGTDFRMILVPAAATGFFTHSRFANTAGIFPGAGADSWQAVYGIVDGVDPEMDPQDMFQATGSNGLPNLKSGSPSTGSVTSAAASTEPNALTGPTGLGGTNPGLSSFELGHIPPVPEPASLGLIGLGIAAFGLLRKSIS